MRQEHDAAQKQTERVTPNMPRRRCCLTAPLYAIDARVDAAQQPDALMRRLCSARYIYHVATRTRASASPSPDKAPGGNINMRDIGYLPA